MESKNYAYKTPPTGGPIETTVFFKPKSGESGLPIAVYYHGGNFVVGHKDMLSPEYVKRLLELGFGAVVTVNYRLAPTISVYDGPVSDSLDAYKWAQAELPALLANDAKVQLDGNRVVTFGHSAGGTLALLAAAAPKPPKAIADFFGMKYLRDPLFHQPTPLPPADLRDATFRDQVLSETPPPTAAPPPFGPKGLDTSVPRSAWFLDQMKNGTLLRSVQPDGDYDKIDPSILFGPKFPPTFFGHGGADTSVNVKFSRQAHEKLKESGVDTELEVIDDAKHGFDVGKKPGDPEFELIARGLKFLRDHV